ncbi:hypothetical protein [Brachybacterium kimchii]|uniref:Helicase XPB/Ssl2 N-terminal domain-containing protein n=1 Tax=Brachybacterium kimchii TaxID=2942909 RepID=A0ABY4N2F5_9MICO|nr:hypothetical protein [Brachybacterium kimchii]UQN28727.1 hypothetical protein M4486_14000 [Brachybacterium kimchii]
MADFLRGSAVPLEASGPTLDEQIDRLAALGLRLHPDCDPGMLARAVARGVTPEDLGGRGSGAHSIPPHRRACFWWLLCEDIGGVPALEHRVRIELEDLAFSAGCADGDDMPWAEQLDLIRRISRRLRAVLPGVGPVRATRPGVDDVAGPAPSSPLPTSETGEAVEPSDAAEKCRARLGGSGADAGGTGLRDRLRNGLHAILPEGWSLVMYRDLVEEAPDLCLVVPTEHEADLRRLILEVLPPTLRAGEEWLERVEQHSTSEQVPFSLGAARMTSGLAVSSVDVPAWQGVHPPMTLADQLENLRRVGLFPWAADIAAELPARGPARIPRMHDRPYHDLFTVPGVVAHRGLLRGIVHLPALVPEEERSTRLVASLTRSLRAMAEVGRPGLAIPRVTTRTLGPRRLEVTAMIDGRVIIAPVELLGGRRPCWDADLFLELAAAELRDDAQRWVALHPGSRSSPVIGALVAVWQVDEMEEMARIAFGDVGRHLAAGMQERTWFDWSDRTGAHDLMLSMTPSGRLAALEDCGISLVDLADREFAARCAEHSSWTGLLSTAHRGHRSVFGHVCVWSAREIADQRAEGLPGAARKLARSVGRRDVQLRITGSEGEPRALVLEVGQERVQLMDRLPAPEEICGLIGDIARHITPPGRELVTLGETRLWPLESRAAELRMLLSGG